MKMKTEHVVIDDQYGRSEFDLHSYVAKDGKEFMYENDCEQHEKKIEIKEKMQSIQTKEGEGLGFETWYYVTSRADIETLVQYIEMFHHREYMEIEKSNVLNCRNEWISFIIDDELTFGNDDGDYWINCTLHSFTKIEENILRRMEQYKKLKKIFE